MFKYHPNKIGQIVNEGEIYSIFVILGVKGE